MSNRAQKRTRWQPADKAWRRRRLDQKAKITVKVDRNPYRIASRATRFIYKTGMTVQQALDAGARAADIKWDTARGHIALR